MDDDRIKTFPLRSNITFIKYFGHKIIPNFIEELKQIYKELKIIPNSTEEIKQIYNKLLKKLFNFDNFIGKNKKKR